MPELNNYWQRTNGYKAGVTSYDLAKTSLSSTASYTTAGKTCSNVEPGLAADTDRLQVDRFFEAANQDIGAKSCNHGRFGSRTGIRARQRTLADLAGCKNNPGHRRLVGDTDVDTQFAEPALIMLH